MISFQENTLFHKECFFSAQAQILLSEIQNSIKIALPYLTKRCLKCYLGREQSFDQGFRVQFSIGKFQPSVAYKSVAYKKGVN